MVYRQEGKYYDIMNPSLIDTVYLNKCKFIPINKLFYEVIITEPVSLSIQHMSNLLSAGKPVGYGGISQGVTSYCLSKHELSPEYINIHIPPNVRVNPIPVYWIRKDNKMLSFESKRDFIRTKKIQIDEKDDLVELIKYAISLN